MFFFFFFIIWVFRNVRHTRRKIPSSAMINESSLFLSTMTGIMDVYTISPIFIVFVCYWNNKCKREIRTRKNRVVYFRKFQRQRNSFSQRRALSRRKNVLIYQKRKRSQFPRTVRSRTQCRAVNYVVKRARGGVN